MYIGFSIEQDHDGIVMDQRDYVDNLPSYHIEPTRAKQKSDNLTKSENKMYRSLVGKCNWAVRGTRPDLAFEVVDMSTKFNCATVNDLLRALKNLRRLRDENCVVKYPRLSLEDARIVCVSDVAFGNMNDGVASCAGQVIFLVESGYCCPLVWRSGKVKRVVKSTLAAEMLSLLEGLEHAHFLQAILFEMLGTKMKVQAFVDNKSVVDSIFSTKLVDDKRLRIDVAIVKEMVKEGNVEVKWIPGTSMIADVLTKKGVNPYPIMSLLQSGKFEL